MIASLREMARTLGGEVVGGQLLCPGPGHAPRDRSLSLKLSASAPDGFTVYSHAGDDFAACRDHVRALLGLAAWIPERCSDRAPIARQGPAAPPEAPPLHDTRAPPPFGLSWAGQLWGEGVDPRGTLCERYLRDTRGLEFGDDLALSVIRWHAGIGAMLSLFRNIHDGRRQAVLRTFINPDATRDERKFTGPTKGAAIMLDAFDAVTTGLHAGEGLETVATARQLGLRPAWALGSSGALASFPVLGGVECLTLLAEHDAASERVVQACAERWHAAGREVLINRPIGGKDLNDAIRGAE